jgi:uncharacterized protein YbbC (DUF1343 family)
MRCAIDKIKADYNILKNMGRLGLVINQTSTSSHYQTTAEIIYAASQKTSGTKVTAVFGPQHGYWQTEQDNMKETPHDVFIFNDGNKVPLFSLYSETRTPLDNQLELVDTLIVDLQDIGCRVYTYMLTLAACMRGAAKHGKKVVVLDRSNPLGLCYFSEEHKKWHRVEGNILQSRFHSFVGWYEIPMRHGLTMGELGKFFIKEDKLNLDYKVIPVDNLYRNMSIENYKIKPWTMPSPNIPSFLSAYFFPAFVTLEGANVSEGRGTTIPFQLIGAPWLNAKKCIQFLYENMHLFIVDSKNKSGLVFREHNFRPTFNKYAGEICNGIQFHIENPENINLYKLGISFLYFCNEFHKNEFKWTDPGYEYNFTDLPINLILGSDNLLNLFEQLERNSNFSEKAIEKNSIEKLSVFLQKQDSEAQIFAEKVKNCFIYETT